jgi:hypothetical protein
VSQVNAERADTDATIPRDKHKKTLERREDRSKHSPPQTYFPKNGHQTRKKSHKHVGRESLLCVL